MKGWKFLTNHTRVLVLIAGDPAIRQRDICWRTDLTGRTVSSILADLCEAGYLSKQRVGTRNVYELHPELPLRGSENGGEVGSLLRLLLDSRQAASAAEA